MSKSNAEKSKGGQKKEDTENYKNGRVAKEEKSMKYNEEKGNGDKYNDKGNYKGKKHTHGGEKKKVSYKKGDKQKKFKTKKVNNFDSYFIILKVI